jgi:hypothetical protein
MRLLYKRNAWANASRCLQEQNFEAPFISNRISYHIISTRRGSTCRYFLLRSVTRQSGR